MSDHRHGRDYTAPGAFEKGDVVKMCADAPALILLGLPRPLRKMAGHCPQRRWTGSRAGLGLRE